MQHFFISANSKDGFYSLYDAYFQTQAFDKIFVLFGGPGTGKSSVMRRIGAAACLKGAHGQYIYCSSDPHSLDGIILTHGDKRVGILDGTPPHPRIITAPAVTEELWDLSNFWDAKMLSSQKKEIQSITEQKKRAYKSAYAFLAAAGTLHEEGCAHAISHLSEEKTRNAIRHKISSLTRCGGGRSIFLRCFSMQGATTLAPHEDAVSRFIPLRGFSYSAEIYLHIFEEELKKQAAEYTLLISPLCPQRADGIYFPATRILLGKEDLLPSRCEERGIHLSTYFNKESGHVAKRLLGYETALTEEAVEILKKAGEAHFSLERIFSSAMDFPAVESMAKKWEACLLQALDLV